MDNSNLLQEHTDNNITIDQQPSTLVNPRERRNRNWQCTSYADNFVSNVLDNLITFKYVRIQEEFGCQDDKKHYQALLIFNEARTLAQVKSITTQECHLEVVKNKSAAYYYARKLFTRGSFIFEHGESPKKEIGAREFDRRFKAESKKHYMLENMFMRHKEGTLNHEELRTYAPELYAEFLTKYDNEIKEKRHPLFTAFITGAGSVGKTLFCTILAEVFGFHTFYMTNDTYFDGISEHHDAIQFDEFISSQVCLQKLNRLIDNKGKFLNVKHSFKECHIKFLLMTSNMSLEDSYRFSVEKPTFDRRIDVNITMYHKTRNINTCHIDIFDLRKTNLQSQVSLTEDYYCDSRIKLSLTNVVIKFTNILRTVIKNSELEESHKSVILGYESNIDKYIASNNDNLQQYKPAPFM